jgi:hypothetical protein
MSFDLFLISFEHKQPSGIPRTAVLAAFGNHLRWADETSGWTQYGSMDGCSINLCQLESDPNLVSCVSVNRPLADERFWASLYKIMRLGNVALFFPGGRPLIAELSVADHLPTLESLGPPIVVHSGSEIVQQIESS